MTAERKVTEAIGSSSLPEAGSPWYPPHRLPWRGDHLPRFGTTEVELCIPPELQRRQSHDGHFILGKSRWMVEERMRVVGDREVRSVVDLGIYP
jgi:hypothetical protein